MVSVHWLTQDSRNALNRSRTGKNPIFYIYSSRFLDRFERLSAEATFHTPAKSHNYGSYASSYRKNVASARRVLIWGQSLNNNYSVTDCSYNSGVCQSIRPSLGVGKEEVWDSGYLLIASERVFMRSGIWPTNSEVFGKTLTGCRIWLLPGNQHSPKFERGLMQIGKENDIQDSDERSGNAGSGYPFPNSLLSLAQSDKNSQVTG